MGSEGANRAVAVLDTLGEAREIAEAVASFRPWIECSEFPGATIDLKDGRLNWRRSRFTAAEKVRLEEIYRAACGVMSMPGVPRQRIDALLPISNEGTLPWD